MKFTYNGKTYRIWFAHHNKPDKIRYTECSIMLETGPRESEELINRDAFCSDGDPERGIPADPYNYAVGRKLSLARALIALTTDRSFRHVAWMAYLNRGRVPADQHKAVELIITGNGEIQ